MSKEYKKGDVVVVDDGEFIEGITKPYLLTTGLTLTSCVGDRAYFSGDFEIDSSVIISTLEDLDLSDKALIDDPNIGLLIVPQITKDEAIRMLKERITANV